MTLPKGTVVPQYQPELKSKAFITVNIVSQQEIGASRLVFDGAKETVKSSLISMVSISCYGKNAVEMTLKLKSILQATRVRERLRGIGGAIINMSDVRNLTYVLGASAEERGQFDVYITHSHVTTLSLEPIELVDIYTNNSIHQHITKD
ncbi:hypothetical protein V757_01095 [Pelistega indica]|uniref:Phage neck terminator protein gp12-like domain-containing protein n=1 Tax=Pelistega indica TaxID=1414851 RepID=V8G8Z4_9BURK|nr:hypothetical protein [Pelistega indica]ETD72969.1 hypothetical protein V757_01095 [Pelistega indica]